MVFSYARLNHAVGGWLRRRAVSRAGNVRFLAIVFGVAACTGCFSDRSEGPAEPRVLQDTLIEVRLTDFAFTPANITINRGARVRWINTTSTFHTVTADAHSEWQRWTTTTAADTFEHVFATAGDFAYFCEPHRTIGMTGSILVR